MVKINSEFIYTMIVDFVMAYTVFTAGASAYSFWKTVQIIEYLGGDTLRIKVFIFLYGLFHVIILVILQLLRNTFKEPEPEPVMYPIPYIYH